MHYQIYYISIYFFVLPYKSNKMIASNLIKVKLRDINLIVIFF